tara:strand:- start:11964 stop:14648 length:2685 start_codon:yes stop_codon:yes gene_type:complete
MRIYKQIKKNNNFLKNKKYFLNLKNIYITFLFLIFGALLFTPLGLLRSNSRFVKIGAKSFHHSLGSIDKKYSLLTKEIFSTADNLFGISYRYLSSIFIKRDLLNINLSFKNYQKIARLRNNAIKNGILVRSELDKVKAYISYKGKNYPVKLRLKGDWTDHLLGEKWSFRVETKNDYPLLGMREFSLQHPRTRSYLNESILHKLLKYEKLPYLRYKFIPVALNGKYLGIYALEEHFGKELIENSGFREGPIIKLSDQDKRNEVNRMLKTDKKGKNNYFNTSQNNAEILTFNMSKTSKDKEKISQYQLGSNLLNEYLKGKLKTSEVFDVSLTAKYFALTDLLQALGANTWYDMRFYFDPISARLIPIGYDAQIPLVLEGRKLNIDNNTLNLFDDPIFIREYIFQLNRITEDNYLKVFLNKISSELNEELLTINKSFPFLRLYSEDLFKNRDYIRNRLSPLNPLGIKSIDISDNKQLMTLKLFNKTKLPIKLKNVVYKGNIYKSESNNFLPFQNKFQRAIDYKIDFINYQKEINNIKEITKKDLQKNTLNDELLIPIRIIYEIEGIESEKTLDLKILKNVNEVLISNLYLGREQNITSFDSLNLDENNKEVYITKNINISKPMVLPEGYKLIVSPGVNINLVKSGSILIKGPLIMNGEKMNKITVNSLEGGKGILVLNSFESSYIRNTIFNGLNSTSTSSTNVTGGLSFYNSKVEIDSVEFRNSQSEDAINLVRSPFLIMNSYFKNTFSDAIDVDFANGTIQDSSFEKIGNDAIDISGAKVNIIDIKINSAGDKAISVGEKSNLYGKNINISNAFIGLASKDLSSVLMKELISKDVTICIAAYQKKAEYGPAFINLKDSDPNCSNNYVLEKGSSIKFSGYTLTPNSVSAYKDLYSLD